MLNRVRALEEMKHPALVALLTVAASRLLLFAFYCLWARRAGAEQGFFAMLYQWDSGLYGNIAANGYTGVEDFGFGNGFTGVELCAFFPLVPVLEGLLYRLGVPLMMTGPLLNTAALYLLNWQGARYVLDTGGDGQTAWFLLLLLDFGPYNIYYSTMYTEAVFALLVCLFLRCMRQKQWLRMGLCGALASAARNLGVFLAVVVFVYSIELYLQTAKQRQARPSATGWCRAVLGDEKLVAGVCLIPLGLFAYMACLWRLLGDPLAFTHVQIAWSNMSGALLDNPLRLLWNNMLDIGNDRFYMGLWGVLALWLCASQLCRRRIESVFSLIAVLVPMTVRVASMPRYVMCTFTVVLEMAFLLRGARRIDKICLGGFLLVMGLLTTRAWFAGQAIMA